MKTLNHEPGILVDIDVSPCGNFLVSACNDKNIKIWDLNTYNEKKNFKGHSDSVTSVKFSPCGKFFASSSSDKTVRLWNL